MPDSISEEEWDEYLESSGEKLTDDYCERFGEYPPVAIVRPPKDVLDRLMREALDRGVALTANDLAKALGGKAPPPGVIV